MSSGCWRWILCRIEMGEEDVEKSWVGWHGIGIAMYRIRVFSPGLSSISLFLGGAGRTQESILICYEEGRGKGKEGRGGLSRTGNLGSTNSYPNIRYTL